MSEENQTGQGLSAVHNPSMAQTTMVTGHADTNGRTTTNITSVGQAVKATPQRGLITRM